VEDRAEVAAVDALHHEIEQRVDVAGVVGGDDILVHERSRRADFAEESLDVLLVFRGRRRQHLHRHLAMHHAVLGAIDRAHAALPQLLEHDVVADHQRLGGALRDDLALMLGQHAAINERLRQLLDRDVLGHVRSDRLRRLLVDDAHGRQLFDKVRRTHLGGTK